MLKLYSHLVTLYFINLVFYISKKYKSTGIIVETKPETRRKFQRREKMKLVKFALYLAIPVSNCNVDLLLICVMQIGLIPA